MAHKFGVGDKVICKRVPGVTKAEGKRGIVVEVSRFTDTTNILDIRFSKAYESDDGRPSNIWKVFDNDVTLLQTAYEIRKKEYIKQGGVVAICADCGKEYIPDDTVTGLEHVCPECTLNYVRCADCGEWVLISDAVETCDSLYIHRECLENGDPLETCMHCGRPILNGYDEDGFGNYAGDMHRRYLYVCEDCGRFVRRGSSEYEIIDGDVICNNCASNRPPRDAVKSYSYKPEPNFGYLEGEEKLGGYGIELEIEPTDCGSRNRDRKTAHILNQTSNRLYCKHDGSLNTGGLEIVTHPCSMAYHKEQFGWDEITQTCIEQGYCGDDSDNGGMHIHASKTLFGTTVEEQELTTAKVIILVNNFFDRELLRFTRRDKSELNQWAKKNCVQFVASDTSDRIKDKLNEQKYSGRYYAVNLQNEYTVEFRIFKSSLNPETILATIQFVDRLIQYSKEHTVAETLDTTWEQLTEVDEMPGYKELNSYLDRKGL